MNKRIALVVLLVLGSYSCHAKNLDEIKKDLVTATMIKSPGYYVDALDCLKAYKCEPGHKKFVLRVASKRCGDRFLFYIDFNKSFNQICGLINMQMCLISVARAGYFEDYKNKIEKNLSDLSFTASEHVQGAIAYVERFYIDRSVNINKPFVGIGQNLGKATLMQSPGYYADALCNLKTYDYSGYALGLVMDVVYYNGPIPFYIYWGKTFDQMCLVINMQMALISAARAKSLDIYKEIVKDFNKLCFLDFPFVQPNEPLEIADNVRALYWEDAPLACEIVG